MLDDSAQAAFEVVAGQPVNDHDSDFPAVDMAEDQEFEKAEHPFPTIVTVSDPKNLRFGFLVRIAPHAFCAFGLAEAQPEGNSALLPQL
jgi:hypothetical protein